MTEEEKIAGSESTTPESTGAPAENDGGKSADDGRITIDLGVPSAPGGYYPPYAPYPPTRAYAPYPPQGGQESAEMQAQRKQFEMRLAEERAASDERYRALLWKVSELERKSADVPEAERAAERERYLAEIEKIRAERDDAERRYEEERSRFLAGIGANAAQTGGASTPVGTPDTYTVYGKARNADYRTMPTYPDFDPAVMAPSPSYEEDVSAFSRAELEKYLKNNEEEIAEHLNDAENFERRQRRAVGNDELRLLVERIGALRAAAELRIANLRACREVGEREPMAKDEKELHALIGDFNTLLDTYQGMTGEDIPRVSYTLPEAVSEGKVYTPLPIVVYREGDYAEKAQSDKAGDRRAMREEQLRLVKEEAAAKASSPDARGKESPEAVFAAATDAKAMKAICDGELRITEERIRYRISAYENELELRRYRFGTQYGGEKRSEKEMRRKLKAMKQDRRAIVSEIKHSNARYTAIVLGTGKAAKSRKRGADEARIASLRARLADLLAERDDLNATLLSLYRNSDKPGKKNMTEKIDDVRRRETIRTARQQKSLERRILSMKLALNKEDKIFELMNRKTDLSADLAVLRFRIRHEKPEGSVRRKMKDEMRRIKKNLRYTENDIDYLVGRAEKSAGIRTSGAMRIVYLILLLLIVAAGAAIWYFFFRG